MLGEGGEKEVRRDRSEEGTTNGLRVARDVSVGEKKSQKGGSEREQGERGEGGR